MNARWARPWFGLTAFLVLVEIVSTLLVTANDESTFGGSPVNRALNIFAFFTIDSNLLIGAVCLLLVIRMNRSSTVFAVFRLTGIVGITVTFIVFHTVLSGLLDQESWAAFNNLLQHTVVPVMAIIGWLAFGPRGLTPRADGGLGAHRVPVALHPVHGDPRPARVGLVPVPVRRCPRPRLSQGHHQ